ncbi:MAG: hypothetical protein HOV71_01450 [Hamadaea sp.]|nr:hypothetical protein [Hamadaea sp.]NUR46776.1 hypothetical protein [Hamadaea sp.]NUT06007.1 hypothetical protein [Hamadaea sp.]
MRTPRGRATGIGAITLAMVLAIPAYASARAPAFQPPEVAAAPSDNRAEYHDGNVTTCADVTGVPDDDIQVGGQGDANAQDQYVIGTTADGKEVNVAITPAGTAAGVVVDAVVVKGGDGYNVYRAPYVPPTLPPDQNYISPLTNGGNVPDISHWFVCYHLEEAPGTNEHAVLSKIVIPPPGVPVEDLPTTYTVTVTCAGFPPFDVTFNSGGGAAVAGQEKLDLVPDGTVCTVAEQGTGGLPDGSEVTYIPADAATTGVVKGEDPLIAVVVNNFSDVDVETTSLQVTKVVDAAAGTTVPDSFTWGISCEDTHGDPTGQIDGKLTPQVVTVAAGGTVLVEDIAVGAHCAVEEDTSSLPAGWSAAYTVGDGQPSAQFPVFEVDDDQAVTVTITNTFAPVPSASPTGPALANTGDPVSRVLWWALGLLLTGVVLVGFAARRRTRSAR